MRHGKGSSKRIRLWIVVGGVVAALGIGEGTYRIARAPLLSPTTNPAYVVHDPVLGWAYRPESTTRHRTAEFDVEVRINGRGFRGAEWSMPDPEVPTVLVLGDSAAFGWGVAESEMFTSLLERGEDRWQIRNAAVSGYGTDQELLLLRELHGELVPDAVVCLFWPNDLFENAGSNSYGKSKPYFVLRDGELELLGQPVPQTWLERYSHLWRAVKKGLWARNYARRPADRDAEWGLTLALFVAMKDELEDVPLLIVSEEGAETEPLQRFAAKRNGVTYLDLQMDFDGTGADPLHFPEDGHWTAEGHARVAAALRRALESLLD